MIRVRTFGFNPNGPGNLVFPLSGAIAARFRVRVQNPTSSAGPQDGFNCVPMMLFLSENLDANGVPDSPICVMGDELVSLNPGANRYWARLALPGFSFGHSFNFTTNAQAYIDVYTANKPEDVPLLAGGPARDITGNARVANFKRWRILQDTGVVNASAGIAPASFFDTGDCTEIAVYQEQGNGSATAAFSILPVSPFGTLGPVLLSTNYGTPALNGTQLLNVPGDPADGLSIPPAIAIQGAPVTGGTAVRLSVIGR